MRVIVTIVGGVIAGFGLAWGLIGITTAISSSAAVAFGPGLSSEGSVLAGFAIMGLGVGMLVAGATYRSQEPDRRREPGRSPAGVA